MASWWWGNPSNSHTSSSPLQASKESGFTGSGPAVPTTRASIPDHQPQSTEHLPAERQTARFSGAASLDRQNRDEEQALEELRRAFYPTSQTDRPAAEDASAPQQPLYDEELYSTKLSCSQCFDAAYYCSSVGGQLTNIYRYGALRSCSELWAQWRFCMRTKTMGDEEKRRRIWEWNREKEARKRLGRSSDEVWGPKRRLLDEEEAGRRRTNAAE